MLTGSNAVRQLKKNSVKPEKYRFRWSWLILIVGLSLLALTLNGCATSTPASQESVRKAYVLGYETAKASFKVDAGMRDPSPDPDLTTAPSEFATCEARVTFYSRQHDEILGLYFGSVTALDAWQAEYTEFQASEAPALGAD